MLVLQNKYSVTQNESWNFRLKILKILVLIYGFLLYLSCQEKLQSGCSSTVLGDTIRLVTIKEYK